MADLEPGAVAPDFTLPLLDGGNVSLKALLDRGPVVLVFLKADCPTCDLAWPYLHRLDEAYASDAWALIGVSQSSEEETREFLSRNNARFSHVLDPEGYPVSKAYDPLSTPTIYVINREGVVEEVLTGFAKDDINALSRRVADWISHRPVEIAPADDGNPPWRPGCVAGHLTMEEVMARTAAMRQK
jgi:peroxiredoxin